HAAAERVADEVRGTVELAPQERDEPIDLGLPRRDADRIGPVPREPRAHDLHAGRERCEHAVEAARRAGEAVQQHERAHRASARCAAIAASTRATPPGGTRAWTSVARS